MIPGCYSRTQLFTIIYLQQAGHHTFINHRRSEGDADDANQVFSGNQRAQDSSDTQRLTFTRIDKLLEIQTET